MNATPGVRTLQGLTLSFVEDEKGLEDGSTGRRDLDISLDLIEDGGVLKHLYIPASVEGFC
mgnify:CR=1 FL=1